MLLRELLVQRFIPPTQMCLQRFLQGVFEKAFPQCQTAFTTNLEREERAARDTLLKIVHNKQRREIEKEENGFQTHTCFQLGCQILELLAIGILQLLVIFYSTKLHMPAEDLCWWAELLTNSGFWISIFNFEERGRWELGVWSTKCYKIAAFDVRRDLGFLNRPGSTFLKLCSVISPQEDSLALRAIKTASWIKRLFIKTSEAFLSDVCVNDKEAVPRTLWHFSPLHY